MKVEIGQWVKVNTDGGKPGITEYVTADGYIGVRLIKEGKRVDEWHPSQVTPITAKEAAKLAKNF